MLVDAWDRPVTYLRVSVTDRCNLRCVYCMPPEGVVRQPHQAILRYEEIAQVVRAAAALGVREVRLTGGEPLVRPGLAALVAQLAAIPGIEDISLTTNALLLEQHAAALKQAGLRRVNISLDTLRPERFARITRGGDFHTAWRGILAAEAHGLTPLKINVVAMRGVNDDELFDLARLVRDHPWHVRFIEVMPVSDLADWGGGLPAPAQAYLPVAEVRQRLAPLALQPVSSQAGSGPAREYTFAGARGSLGFIAPVSEHFCQECNRLRLTADGHLRACLLSDVEIPLRETLRAGQDITPLLEQAVALKPRGHTLTESQPRSSRSMSQIGG